MIRIFVLGDSSRTIDKGEANSALWGAIAELMSRRPSEEIVIGSRTEDVGIHALAYRLAKIRGLKTYCITCRDEILVKSFPVDEIIRIESGELQARIIEASDYLVRVGGEDTERAIAKEFGSQKGTAALIEKDLLNSPK